MKNEVIAKIFENMAAILEIEGAPNAYFRVRAYQNAAQVLKELPIDVEELILRGEMLKIPGIGEILAQKIREYIKTGKIEAYEIMLKMYPQSLLDLLKIQSLGPKKLKLLHETFGVKDLNSLEKVMKSGQAEMLPKFKAKTIANILHGLDILKNTQDRVLLGFIYPKVQDLLTRIKKIPGVKKIEVAGSFRRRQETIGDIDILVAGKNPSQIFSSFLKFPEIKRVLAHGETKSSVLIDEGRQVDLRIVNEENFGAALQYFTGSKKHNIAIRKLANNLGLTINEYALSDIKTGEVKVSKSEEKIYQALGLQYIPPEIRNDTGEIEAAQQNKIPKLIEFSDIKGDLHIHSNYSDGKNSIEQMVVAAIAKGYEYIAITDHSPRLTVAHGLHLEDLQKKQAEILALNKKFPIKILYGTEVDILEDGSLDYPNEILKNFDMVIASIHYKFNQDNTERISKAMQNPFVHAIGHLTGRMIGSRDSYPLDFDKVFQVAAKTQTWLEINAQPERMDLPDIYIRRAKEAGCKFIIDTDSHFNKSLWLMDLGVSYARRGWLTESDVINTLKWKDLKSKLKYDSL
ncbi:MAG: PHP domain-containing protein, DNA polymerase (family X) [Candidatus Peregrinibacteria bacterium GW2011_GWF2_33_10]|nr:MAG: PHP domain-containing protein, DNA polymerase (family X) [Candidatus Peregrinibacteria bacterium GW2011_GWF2_33_10]OGJ44835.1 MAG: hypothetical protein A2263_06390 [Candidatus Peregrinibacteria bacterium RIFOXYA2_FULL_33_21]OGJ47121.1 MAG: hypothetical protein A2272_03110 [Candidatus Peregrinibacteria bacterium RIFOXYA12_FULL_33_12]OGJ50521.1 MAG: hypothetical protein A2307_03015 [Candidatus Peregrinibacteria bacterium RIFOXYB2_FULL_33_20]